MAQNQLRRRTGFSVALRSVAVLLVLGVIGFVMLSDTLPARAPAPDPAPEARPAGSTAVVTTDGLNVRDGASLDAAVIDTFPRGARLEVFGEPRNGFTPVRYTSGQAWMASEFLDVDGTVPITAEGSSDEAQADRERSLARSVAAGGTDLSTGDAVSHERWIDVDRTTGIVALRDGPSTIATYTGKTGADPSAEGFYATAPGTFHVYSMNEDLAPTPFAEGVYLTDWVGFDSIRSNGFHSPTRDASGNVQPTQNATTLGCVRLDAEDAARVFDFSFIGMRVEIHD